jgi:hypothetical protein
MPSIKSAHRQKSVVLLAALECLDEAVLRQRWTDCYGHPPPARLSRTLLLRAVAYHQQSKVLGGLNGHLRRRLATLTVDAPANNITTVSPMVRLTPGTQLVRNWQGQAHRVQVTENGFEYRGNAYRSLSHIAREITGTSWSGPAFFGLRNRKLVEETVHG